MLGRQRLVRLLQLRDPLLRSAQLGVDGLVLGLDGLVRLLELCGALLRGRQLAAGHAERLLELLAPLPALGQLTAGRLELDARALRHGLVLEPAP